MRNCHNGDGTVDRHHSVLATPATPRRKLHDYTNPVVGWLAPAPHLPSRTAWRRSVHTCSRRHTSSSRGPHGSSCTCSSCPTTRTGRTICNPGGFRPIQYRSRRPALLVYCMICNYQNNGRHSGVANVYSHHMQSWRSPTDPTWASSVTSSFTPARARDK